MFRISGHVVVVTIYNDSANVIDLRERDDGRLGQLEREVDCAVYSVMLLYIVLYSYIAVLLMINSQQHI